MIDLEFSKNAHRYDQYNTIQKQVTKELLSVLKYQPKKILDLGCGNGSIFKEINWEVDFFLGVDFAKKMLELHPKGKNIECIYGDFDNKALYEHLFLYDFDYILSASAFQWSKDLDRLFENLSSLYFNDFAFAIFSANTFKTIHKTANITSVLQDTHSIIKSAQKYFTCNYHIKQYSLEFQNNLEMFRYIKKSGVSGNRGVLDFKQTKELIQNYPLSYLEFEVVFLYS